MSLKSRTDSIVKRPPVRVSFLCFSRGKTIACGAVSRWFWLTVLKNTMDASEFRLLTSEMECAVSTER